MQIANRNFTQRITSTTPTAHGDIVSPHPFYQPTKPVFNKTKHAQPTTTTKSKTVCSEKKKKKKVSLREKGFRLKDKEKKNYYIILYLNNNFKTGNEERK